MARPKSENKRIMIHARLPQEVYNSIVSYQTDKNIETFTKAVEDVLSYGILYYYTTNTTSEL